MKKRIGTKLYDTETSEHVCSLEGGQLYRKCTRDREWFAVMDDGTVRPLDAHDPRDAILMKTGDVPEDNDPESKSIMVRVDRETHKIIADEAKRCGVSMAEAIRALILR